MHMQDVPLPHAPAVLLLWPAGLLQLPARHALRVHEPRARARAHQLPGPAIVKADPAELIAVLREAGQPVVERHVLFKSACKANPSGSHLPLVGEQGARSYRARAQNICRDRAQNICRDGAQNICGARAQNICRARALNRQRCAPPPVHRQYAGRPKSPARLIVRWRGDAFTNQRWGFHDLSFIDPRVRQLVGVFRTLPPRCRRTKLSRSSSAMRPDSDQSRSKAPPHI
eukprot:335654-Chlamydomonas_euryale.AAC.3